MLLRSSLCFGRHSDGHCGSGSSYRPGLIQGAEHTVYSGGIPSEESFVGANQGILGVRKLQYGALGLRVGVLSWGLGTMG